jgi:hypothetical protein
MEFDIESWVPYRYDFKPITINSLFSDALGHIAELAMRMDSEFLYMETADSPPVGTLVPENLIRPRVSYIEDDESEEQSDEGGDAAEAAGPRNFAMVFSYSRGMEKILSDLADTDGAFGAGITHCGIRRSEILMDQCKVLVVASGSPFFNPDDFLRRLGDAMEGGGERAGGNVPYFAEKFGYRRCAIPYETDDVTDLMITGMLMSFEFDEIREIVGPIPEVSIDNF